MDTKKPFASLLEDHTPGSRTATPSFTSPFLFRPGHRVGASSSSAGSSILFQNAFNYSTSHNTTATSNCQDTHGPSTGPVLSCVSKDTYPEDCAQQRFIVWAAVKRNESLRKNPEKKLECPLLKCDQRFGNHEAMLKHLAACTYLADREYWCYDHMKVERFDDIKCKRCLGHNSKRRKVLSMAKGFFHRLGHKSKKEHGMDYAEDDQLLPPPPSYESIGGLPAASEHIINELPPTEILEADSVEVPVPQAQPLTITASDGIDPQALLVPVTPAVPELDSTMMSWASMPIPISTIPHVLPEIQPEDCRAVFFKPALQVTTNGLQPRRPSPRPVSRPIPPAPRSKGLSPSSSVRSTASTDSTVSTDSTTSTDSTMTNDSNITMSSIGSSLVSPVSDYSGDWSMASGIETHKTSPDDKIMIDNPFGDQFGYNDGLPDFMSDVYELPADFPISRPEDRLTSASLFPFDTTVATAFSYAPEINLPEDPIELLALEEANVEQPELCCSETKSLISSAWDALQEHYLTSMMKVKNLQPNPLSQQLASMSIGTMAKSGLRTLQGLLDGQRPRSANDALCLVHLVCALSLAVYEEEAANRVKDLYLQSLVYINALPPDQREFYYELTVLIWQPPDLSQLDVSSYLMPSPSLSFDPKGKLPDVFAVDTSHQTADALLMTARDFLDKMEITLLSSRDSLVPHDVQFLDLSNKHLQDSLPTGSVNESLTITVKYALEALVREFLDVTTLTSELEDVFQRVLNGTITSVRRVEIEILRAGQKSMAPPRYFDSFVPKVRKACDQIYNCYDVGTSRRNDYHSLGIRAIDSLIPEFDSNTGAGVPDLTADDFDAYINDLNTTELMDQTGSMAGLDMAGIGYGHKGTKPDQSGTTSPGEGSSSSSTLTPHSEGQLISAFDQQQKADPNSCCDICGYKPKGDPQWFKGSMAKHKKLQHSNAPPRIYKCPFPGCSSQYKNRPDNLRQHQIEKNHFVEGEEIASKRPSKRKKVEKDD
ncbi:hypothetical protein QBC38DRAFT_265859 [Podospora fimiseda]|uniref:Uncharacterized protein n=1 Tax=Podospora fimiseda TaxID=252190 RepID=A0AAN7BLE0_9PEZI|nr:hypothetical protein QBC38DRAFT_265859 [Podospora fimiseda]